MLTKMWRNWISHTLPVEVQNGATALENSWQFLIKLNVYLPRDPAITFLGIYPRGLKTYVHKSPCS